MARFIRLVAIGFAFLTTQNNLCFANSAARSSPELDRIMALKALMHLDRYLTVAKTRAKQVQKYVHSIIRNRGSVKKLCGSIRQLGAAADRSYGFVIGNESGELHLWLPSDSELESITATVSFASNEMDVEAQFCRDSTQPVELDPLLTSIENIIDQNNRVQDLARYLMKVIQGFNYVGV
ncbi:MAG: hypothetical protein AABZ55_15225 [Bdellovibrionota bacterium]